MHVSSHLVQPRQEHHWSLNEPYVKKVNGERTRENQILSGKIIGVKSDLN